MAIRKNLSTRKVILVKINLLEVYYVTIRPI